jgi:hypothetical protein
MQRHRLQGPKGRFSASSPRRSMGVVASGMSRVATALSFSALVVLSLACAGPEAPPAPPMSTGPEPGCCAYKHDDGHTQTRTDVTKDACLAHGDSWSNGPQCEPVCCVLDGKAVTVLGGDCGRRDPLAEASACAPGASLPSTCCEDQGKVHPSTDLACTWKETTGELTLTYRSQGDRTGLGRLVAGPQCDTVCCEYADYSVHTELRGECSGTVVVRAPCVPEYPATRVCCQTTYDTTGASVTRLSWSADGSCGGGLSDGTVLADAECAGLAHGEERETWESDGAPEDGADGEAPPPPAEPATPARSERARPTSEGKPR